MQIFITPNIKKYFKTYIDFLDHYWINFFKKKNLKYIMLNSEINNSLKILKSLKKKNNLLILTGGSDVEKKLIYQLEGQFRKKLIKFALKIYQY